MPPEGRDNKGAWSRLRRGAPNTDATINGDVDRTEAAGLHSPPSLHVVGAPTNGARTRREIKVTSFATAHRDLAKAAFTTRNVPPEAMVTLISGGVRPRTGDLVLARVDRLGQHSRIELPTGRRASLYPGDEIIVTYADRYAPDQFEAEVPADLGPTQLVAGGGVAADVLSRSAAIRRATDITPIALIGDVRGVPLNLSDFALKPVQPINLRPRTLAVVGTSMNSGKTTTVRTLVHALSRAGHAPGATKVTGTGSGNDYWVMLDSGAHRMLDFTDVGLASTYRIPIDVVERKFLELIDHLTDSDCGAIVVEIADGLFQRETSRIIRSDVFLASIDRVMFSAADAMGAVAGVEHLQRLGHAVVGVSGLLTRSPLATQEAREACGVPVYTLSEMLEPGVAEGLVGFESVSFSHFACGHLPEEHTGEQSCSG